MICGRQVVFSFYIFFLCANSKVDLVVENWFCRLFSIYNSLSCLQIMPNFYVSNCMLKYKQPQVLFIHKMKCTNGKIIIFQHFVHNFRIVVISKMIFSRDWFKMDDILPQSYIQPNMSYPIYGHCLYRNWSFHIYLVEDNSYKLFLTSEMCSSRVFVVNSLTINSIF